MSRLLIALSLLPLLSLPRCATKITNADQMREAVLNDRVRTVRRAVRAGYPVAEDVSYCFPLVPFAAATGHERVVVAVLDARPGEALVNQPNCMGHTALHFARLTRNESLARALLKRGADPGRRDLLERTADELGEETKLP